MTNPAGGTTARGEADEAAIRTDVYIELLLSGWSTPSVGGDRPPVGAAPAPDADIRRAADLLRAGLARVHPSFRFEERLARDLGWLASGSARAAGGGPTVRGLVPAVVVDGDELANVLGELSVGRGRQTVARWRAAGRPILIGGALTSAALSLAGAAIVAWRRGVSRGDPFARVVRAAHRRRPAGAGLPWTGPR